MRYETGDRTHASRGEAAKFKFLRTAGFVIEGQHDQPGTSTVVSVTEGGNRWSFPVRVEHRQFDGVMHTAYVPSNRSIAEMRKTMAMQ